MKKTDLFLYLNLFCNDNCSFCFFSKLPFRQNFLTPEDIKKIFRNLKADKIRGVVLTGGEPTLNPYFWKIIGYIYQNYLRTGKIKELDLSTNAITSADKRVAKRLEKYFSPFKGNDPDIKISFSLSSFNDSSENKNKIRNKKNQGVKNLLMINANIESVITITKDNYKEISRATDLLISYAKKRPKEYFFKIDYRLPYTSMMYNATDLERIILPSKIFRDILNKLLNKVRNANIHTTLHNIPLCYIKDHPEYFIGRKPPCGLAIFPDIKIGFVKREKNFKFDKNLNCRKCILKGRCSGIEKIYLEKYNYLKLKPLKRDEVVGNKF